MGEHEDDDVAEIPGMVGEPPAGDESPDDFVSNDQSAAQTTSGADDEATDGEDA
jgi:hypothetical protein